MYPPTFIMLVGLPASGKSSFANTIYFTENNKKFLPTIHSSDEIRKEIFNDINNQNNNDFVFKELKRRIMRDLIVGKDVVFDACNIDYKKRTTFLEEISNIKCKKIGVHIATPYEVCLKRNNNRERHVPENVIKNMYTNWTPLSLNEGFDDIATCYDGYDNKEYISELSKYNICNYFCKEIKADDIDQENKNHELTIGKHCKAAANYIKNKYGIETRDNINLFFAALLHDTGKVFTKTRVEGDENCHYYKHQNVSAYDSLFYLKELDFVFESDIMYIANLIYWHMRPLTGWIQSEKCKNREIAFIGTKMYEDVMKLHEADLYAQKA